MSHKDDCLCVTCINAGMDAHLVSLGIDPRKYPKYGNTEVLERPKTSTNTGTGRAVVNLATPPQVKFLTSLLADKDTTGIDVPKDMDAVRALSVKAASALIDRLVKAPYLPRTPKTGKPGGPTVQPKKLVGPGLYKLDGEVYRVKLARQSGHAYAQRLNEFGRFDYSGGVILRLTEDMRMSVDEVEELSIAYHMCMICSRELTNETSIQLGIGPICRSKY